MNGSKGLNELRAARQTFSVLVRVVDELCATELTYELITMVTSFVYKLIREGNYDFARLLRLVLTLFEFKNQIRMNKVGNLIRIPNTFICLRLNAHTELISIFQTFDFRKRLMERIEEKTPLNHSEPNQMSFSTILNQKFVL